MAKLSPIAICGPSCLKWGSSSIDGGREIYQGDKQDQEVAEGCKRLINNAMVCWNYLFLTQKIAEHAPQATRQAWLQSVAAGSGGAWRHVNLLGEYDFSDEKLRDSIGIRLPAHADCFLRMCPVPKLEAARRPDVAKARLIVACKLMAKRQLEP